MKTNKLFFYAFLASFTIFQSMSPTEYRAHVSALYNRAPASDETSNAKENAAPEKLCEKESQGDKLNKDTQNLIEDKEAILKQLADLKKENLELKDKINPSESKKEKKEKKEKREADSEQFVSLLSQMTSLFSTQMENQMKNQMMIIELLSQSQNSWASSNQPFSMNYLNSFSRRSLAAPSNQDDFGYWNVGLPAYQTQYSLRQDYQNPYIDSLQLIRQPISDSGFSVSPAQPRLRGYDFSQNG